MTTEIPMLDPVWAENTRPCATCAGVGDRTCPGCQGVRPAPAAPPPMLLVVTWRGPVQSLSASYHWRAWLDGAWRPWPLPGQTHEVACAHRRDLPRDAERIVYRWLPPDPVLERPAPPVSGLRLSESRGHRDAVRAYTGRTPACRGALLDESPPETWRARDNDWT